MTLNEFQEASYKNVKPHTDNKDEILDYCLGLSEEVGETVSIIKHHYYGKEPVDKYKLSKELGDILWYLSALSSVYDLYLDDIAQLNINKLSKRYNNGFSYENSKNRHKIEENEE